MKILDVMWFSGRSHLGIVKVFDDYDGIKYYIGSPSAVVSEEVDKQWIADWGSTFPYEAGNVLFGDDELRNGNAVPVPKNKEQAILMYQLGKNYLGIE